jgi:hypothetical protein
MEYPTIYQGDIESLPKEVSKRALGEPKEYLWVLVELL